MKIEDILKLQTADILAELERLSNAAFPDKKEWVAATEFHKRVEESATSYLASLGMEVRSWHVSHTFQGVLHEYCKDLSNKDDIFGYNMTERRDHKSHKFRSVFQFKKVIWTLNEDYKAGQLAISDDGTFGYYLDCLITNRLKKNCSNMEEYAKKTELEFLRAKQQSQDSEQDYTSYCIRRYEKQTPSIENKELPEIAPEHMNFGDEGKP